MTDKATRECKLRYAFRATGRYNTPSERITWCCRDRHGFMLKHWKCVGMGNKDCPLTNGKLSQAAREWLNAPDKTGVQ